MEVILEMLAQLIFEGAFEASNSSKVPLWLRWILAVSIFGFGIFIGGFLLYGGISFASKKPVEGILIATIGGGMVIFSIWQILKFSKKIKKEKSKNQQ